MLAKYDTSFFTKDQNVHSDLHHDSTELGTHLDILDKTDKFYDNFLKTCFSASY